MLDIKNIELIVRPIQAVQFTGDNYQDLKTWVQDKLSFQTVTATAERLYLPSIGGVEILEPGDWVFYDPQDDFFRGATDDAVVRFYQQVEEPAEEPPVEEPEEPVTETPQEQ